MGVELAIAARNMGAQVTLVAANLDQAPSGMEVLRVSSVDELEQACLIAHERGARIYLTLNVLIKPAELAEALLYLGECIDRGIDAAIVQDIHE